MSQSMHHQMAGLRCENGLCCTLLVFNNLRSIRPLQSGPNGMNIDTADLRSPEEIQASFDLETFNESAFARVEINEL